MPVYFIDFHSIYFNPTIRSRGYITKLLEYQTQDQHGFLKVNYPTMRIVTMASQVQIFKKKRSIFYRVFRSGAPLWLDFSIPPSVRLSDRPSVRPSVRPNLRGRTMHIARLIVNNFKTNEHRHIKLGTLDFHIVKVILTTWPLTFKVIKGHFKGHVS